MKKKTIFMLLTVLVLILPGCRNEDLNVVDDSSGTVSESIENLAEDEKAIRNDVYFIVDGSYYRAADIELEIVQERNHVKYFYKGVQVESFYLSEEECIQAGYKKGDVNPTN